MGKLRYQLHWAGQEAPKPSLKWVIYDWVLIHPVAYIESRVMGRKVVTLLNAEFKKELLKAVKGKNG